VVVEGLQRARPGAQVQAVEAAPAATLPASAPPANTDSNAKTPKS
jgi:hypothetical protein